jgi:two-component system chemotaxis response regulator CheY
MAIKCLIVEDSGFIREIYHYVLQDFAELSIVAEADDGVTAVQLIEQHQPDLLILDLVLPLKDGLEVLKSVSQISPHTKAVVISSLDEEHIIAKAKALGAVEYVIKPFTKKQLLSVLQQVTATYAEVQNG